MLRPKVIKVNVAQCTAHFARLDFQESGQVAVEVHWLSWVFARVIRIAH